MALRLHADESLLPPGAQPAPILYPFWGVPDEDHRDVTAGRFDRLVAEGPEFLELSGFDAAQVVVFPATWQTLPDVEESSAAAVHLARRAAEAGKPLAIFFVSDSAEPVPVEPAFVFRTSLYRSRRRAGEHALPAWSEDFLERYLGGGVPLRPRRDVPVVSFMGYDTPVPALHKRLAKRLLGRGTLSSRGRVLRAVQRSPLVGANIVVRDAFFGGALAGGEIDYPLQHRVRREYVENVVGGDYVLAARGSETWGATAGNFSYRLYEVLSCGRIPIFINTDSVLPYEDGLDWRSFTVWLEEDELDDADRRLRAFHDGLSPGEFEALQRECRRVWEEYVSPHGFFRHFHLHFR